MEDMSSVMSLLQNFLQDSDQIPGIIQIGNQNKIEFVPPQTKSLERTVKSVEFASKEIYKQLTLPKLSWMDEGMDMDLDTFFMKPELTKGNNITSLEEIFHCSCNRILIEGKPGFGKTTLCIKLLHDWAHNASYTTQFQLAFWIPLRNLPEEGIEEALAAYLPTHGIDRVKLMEIISEAGEKVLIVLDGFDELSKNKRKNVLTVMYRQKYCEATVVLTTRSSEFNVQAAELEEIFGISAFSREFIKVKYIITGLREREVIKFVNRVSLYCNVKCLEKMEENNPELFQCPLFVIIFTFLTCCNENIDELNTKTRLYRALFNCIIKHSLNKAKIIVSEHFDIFTIGQTESAIHQENLEKFGKIITENITQLQLQFDVDDLTIQIYKMGLLIKHQQMSIFKTKLHFEVFHRSILEFIIAYSIWRQCVIVDFKLTDEIVLTLVSIFMHYKNSQILEFFIGLCENNLLEILGYLKSYVSIYWSVEDYLWELISRNKLNTDLLKQVCNFMPFQRYASSVDAEELKMSVLRGHIKKLCIFADEITHLPLPRVRIPELQFIVTDTAEKLSLPHLQGVKCSNFVLDFQFAKVNSQIFLSCLQVLNTVESEKNIIINLTSETIMSLPSEFYSLGIKIDHLECAVTGTDQNEFDRIGIFTTVCKTESLKFDIFETTFTTRYNVIEIIPLLPMADEVTVIKSGDEIAFHLQDVAMADRKQWYSVLSEGKISPSSQYVKINYININSPYRDLLLSALRLTLVSQLRCFSGHLTYALNELPSSWPGFECLEALSLLLCNNQTAELWEKVKRFKNLNSLELQMMWKPCYKNHTDAILNCISCLPVCNLSFHLESKDDIVFIDAFIKKFKEIQCSLKVINIISIQNYDCLLVPELLECVKLKILEKVQFIVDPNVWFLLMRSNVIDFSIFQILHDEFVFNKTRTKSEVDTLPIAFDRPPDPTKNVHYIQILLKHTN